MNIGFDQTQMVPALVVAYFYGIVSSLLLSLLRYIVLSTLESRERR